MKTYSKKHMRMIIALACISLVFSVLILLLVQRYALINNGDDTKSVPTKPIGKNQSVGGQVDDSHSGKSKNSKSNSMSKNSSSAQSEAALAIDPSPKQTQIKKTISKEYTYTAFRTSNDPYAASSWSLSNMSAPAAWDTTVGNGVLVAVIDTGFGLNHEDLANQWFTNQAETGQTQAGDRCWTGTTQNKSTNNCDDDNNGYVDDNRGWDFDSRDKLPQAGQTNPTGQGVSHGTEVAGLVGATGNNGLGSATLSWDTTIMPLQALDDNGSGYTSDVVAAIYYAVDMGAEVINMSLGGYSLDPALQPAIDYAYQNGVVVVAAAGNCGTGLESGCNPSNPGAMGYPALNDHVISVGATTSSNTRASFSSYGPGLDVVAPGSGTIIAPLWQQSNQVSSYAGTLYGTSFASPYVASLAALVKSVRPNTSVDDITALVDGTATKVSGMSSSVYSNTYGHGLVNANAIVGVASALNSSNSQPTLSQAGSSISEHFFNSSSTLNSGCQGTDLTYCTVRIRSSSGYDRYMPYTQISGGEAGWSWSGNILSTGDWEVRSVQGQYISQTPYMLYNK